MADRILLPKRDDGWGRTILRRYWRAYRGEPEVPKNGKSPYKDLRRFCRGKEGLEHIWETRVVRYFSLAEDMADFCERCGKRRPHSSFRVWVAPKPDWARRYWG